MIYKFIQKYHPEFGVRWLLRKFDLSSNAYYNFLKNRKASYYKNKQKRLQLIKEIYHRYDGKPGYGMIKELDRDNQIKSGVLTLLILL